VNVLTAKYYIRPRKVEDPKKWLGPFDVNELKEQAERRLFSKELHEYSEDQLNWVSARQIWPTLFPKNAKSINAATQPAPAPTQPSTVNPPRTANEGESLGIPAPPPQEARDWYCVCDGRQHGPFTLSQLRELAVRGQLQPDDLIWQPALGDLWVEARSNPTLFRKSTPDLVPTNSGSQRTHSQKSSGLAVASFVLGMLGMCPLPAIGSILAIVFGHIALAKMGRQRASESGKWMAITGVVLGYVMLATLMIAGTAFVIIRRNV
jgi:hypothetical protein